MAEHYDNGGRLTKYEYAPDPDDFERGQMVNSDILRQVNYDSDSESDESDDAYEYTLKKEKFYKQLFSKPLKKIRFAISSSNRDIASYPNVEDCKILLNDTNNINEFDNVVGFNILSSTIAVSYYNINSINKSDLDTFSGGAVAAGYYTTATLPDITKITSHSKSTGKLTFDNTPALTTTNKSLAKVLGLGYSSGNYTSASPILTDIRGTGFFDIEISNIPSISCIHTNYSKNIVSRIPITSSSYGSIIQYKALDTDMSSNHFFPIKLTHLDIKVLDEFGNTIGMNGVDYNLVCEVIIMGDLPENL